jgi:subtilisin family serine protease
LVFPAEAQSDPEPALWTALESGGSARVIVQFEYPSAPGNRVTDTADLVVRRQVISELADEILDSLPRSDGTRATALSRFAITPAMVMEANQAQLDQLLRDPRVIHVVPDRLESASLDQSIRQIGALGVISSGITGAGQTIAFLDTGIDLDHPAFAGRISSAACFSSTVPSDQSSSLCPGGADSDTTSAMAGAACSVFNDETGCFHGTHVASIAAGARGHDDDYGAYDYLGVAPAATIVPVQVFSRIDDASVCPAGVCIRSYVSDQLQALEWLYTNRASLGLTAVNMSLGGERHRTACDDDVRAQVIGLLSQAGIPTFVSSGNEGWPDAVSAPACISTAIAVAGATPELSPVGNTGPQVDLLAPGTDITAASPLVSGSPVRTLSGTSMAAPHAAGAFALLASGYPSASADDILDALSGAGTPVSLPQSGSRPFIRVDLANLRLSDGANSALAVIAPNDPLISGYFGDETTYNTLTYTLVNNSNTATTFSLRNFGKDLDFTADGLQSTVLSTHIELTGTLAAGESIDVEVSSRSPGNTVSETETGFTLVHNFAPREFDIVLVDGYPPARNDNRANAFRLNSQYGFVISPLFGPASYEYGEVRETDMAGSVWYEWRPALDGLAAINVSYDGNTTDVFCCSAPVYIYQQASGALQTIATPAANTVDGRVSFEARAGETYLIQVHAPYFAENDLSINLVFEPSPSDQVSQESYLALPLMAAGYEFYPFSRVGDVPASESDPVDGPQDPFRTWYRWTAPATGILNLRVVARNRIEPPSSIAVFHRPDGETDLSASDVPDQLELLAGVQLTEANIDAPLEVPVTEGKVYWIRIGGQTDRAFGTLFYGLAPPGPHVLRTAVLPNTRSVQIGETATAFMTVLNPASSGLNAQACRIEAARDSDVRFVYRETDATNTPVGSNDPRFDLAPGELKTFVISFVAPDASESEFVFNVYCNNQIPTDRNPTNPVDDFILRTVPEPALDVISIALTPDNNGIIDVSNTRFSAFALAAINNGLLSGDVRIEAEAVDGPFGRTADNVTVEICETDPADGRCLSSRASSMVSSYGPGGVRTYSVFVRSADQAAGFAPMTQRIYVRFYKAGSLTLVGQTSVAWRALGD